jgi:hypothetical protein
LHPGGRGRKWAGVCCIPAGVVASGRGYVASRWAWSQVGGGMLHPGGRGRKWAGVCCIPVGVKPAKVEPTGPGSLAPGFQAGVDVLMG